MIFLAASVVDPVKSIHKRFYSIRHSSPINLTEVFSNLCQLNHSRVDRGLPWMYLLLPMSKARRCSAKRLLVKRSDRIIIKVILMAYLVCLRITYPS